MYFFSLTQNDHRSLNRRRSGCVIAIFGKDKTLIYNARGCVFGQPFKKILGLTLPYNPLKDEERLRYESVGFLSGIFSPDRDDF